MSNLGAQGRGLMIKHLIFNIFFQQFMSGFLMNKGVLNYKGFTSNHCLN